MKISSLLDKLKGLSDKPQAKLSTQQSIAQQIIKVIEDGSRNAMMRCEKRKRNNLPEPLILDEYKEITIFDNNENNTHLKLVKQGGKSFLVANRLDLTSQNSKIIVQVSDFSETIKLFEMFFDIKIGNSNLTQETSNQICDVLEEADPEIEVKFLDIDVDNITSKLENIGARMIKPYMVMKRVVYYRDGIKGLNLRIRDEGESITMTVKKVVDQNRIDGVKERNIVVSNFDDMILILGLLGVNYSTYRQSARELWKYEDVDICIDEWPGLRPFVEIEGKTEEKIRNVSELLGFDYSKGVFGVVSNIYRIKRGISPDELRDIPVITFDKNPWKETNS